MNSLLALSASSQIRLIALQQRGPRFWTAEERRFAFAVAKANLGQEKKQQSPGRIQSSGQPTAGRWPASDARRRDSRTSG